MPIQSIHRHLVMSSSPEHLSHDTIALAWRRAWRRLVLRATVRRLRRLQFDAILLLAVVITLVRAIAAVVSVVGIACLSGVRGRWLAVLVIVVVIGCGGVCVVSRTGGPACAVERLAACFAAATGC
jgi:hypothetical protein